MKKIVRGFTLIELIIYMGLLALMLGVLSNIFASAMDVQIESSATTSIDRDANYLFNRMAYDIHRADSITTPLTLGSTSSSLTVSINSMNHIYSTDANGNLTYVNNLGTFTLNSYDTTVSGLSFKKIGNVGGVNDTIQINFTLTSTFTPHKGAETKAFSTTIGLRR